MFDEHAEYNRNQWNELARAGVEWSQPFLDLTADTAKEIADPHNIIGEIKGKNVLCLASGGGQQSAVFGILGANVTVFDLSDAQLERDRQAAAHYGYPLCVEHGDMRDLSRFSDKVFDIVWQPYSINFVPSVTPVIEGAARITIPGGIYYLQFANPFTITVDDEAWDGDHYPLKHEYLDGFEITSLYPHWDVPSAEGMAKIAGPKEYRHNLSTVVNSLSGAGFKILGLWEYQDKEQPPEPGNWRHFMSIAPPYLMIWSKRS